MRVSGFTFIKDAVKFDFPIKEAIMSVLPLCDEFIVGVGTSNDGTLDVIKSIDDPKLRIIQSEWSAIDAKEEHIFARKTNEVLAQCTGDWCFYIQGDEAVHEQDYEKIRQAMIKYLNDDEIDGLLFHYYHFYGTPDIVVDTYHWYQNEIRIIKNNRGIRSWRDAQGFRKENGEKLRVAHTGAYVYHYGWTRRPEIMLDKLKAQWEYSHGPGTAEERFKNFPIKRVYYRDPYTLKPFTGSHPAVMRDWVEQHRWDFKIEDIEFKHNFDSLRRRLQLYIYKFTGLKIGEYKNYILVKK